MRHTPLLATTLNDLVSGTLSASAFPTVGGRDAGEHDPLCRFTVIAPALFAHARAHGRARARTHTHTRARARVHHMTDHPHCSTCCRPGGARPRDVLVFIVGGATYSEARVAHNFNELVGRRAGVRVVLGGTHVHNISSFMEEVVSSTSS
jgi:hypothetical protein